MVGSVESQALLEPVIPADLICRVYEGSREPTRIGGGACMIEVVVVGSGWIVRCLTWKRLQKQVNFGMFSSVTQF